MNFLIALKLREKTRYFETRIKRICRQLATMTDQEERDRMQELKAAFILKREKVSVERHHILLYKVKSLISSWSDAFLDSIITLIGCDRED